MNKIEEDNKSVGNTSNSDNINENGKMEKKSRSTKKEMYNQEREEIIKELNEIIGLNENNKSVLLYDLETNKKVKENLKNNIEKIKKYYKYGTWGYFSNDIKKGMNNEISLLRAIYKNDNYDITSKRKIYERDGKKRLHIELFFYKK